MIPRKAAQQASNGHGTCIIPAHHMPMKYTLPALLAALLLTSCAGVHVVDTQVATGATDPDVIYIRPFHVEGAEFTGEHAGGPGERPIRKSLAPAEFAIALQEELEKIAP